MTNGVSGAGMSAGGMSAGTDETSDLNAIYIGGEHFLARMKAMSDRTAGLQKAFADLKVGLDAVQALTDAQAKHGEAKKALDEAKKKVADAEKQAASIISKAQSEAALTQRNAQSAAASLRRDADSLKLAAQQARDEAESAKTHAAALLVDTQAEHDRVTALKTDTANALKTAEDAQKTHLDAKAAYDARVKLLRQAHQEFLSNVERIAKS